MKGLRMGQCAAFTDGCFMLGACELPSSPSVLVLLPRATALRFLLISDVITWRCSARPHDMVLALLHLFFPARYLCLFFAYVSKYDSWRRRLRKSTGIRCVARQHETYFQRGCVTSTNETHGYWNGTCDKIKVVLSFLYLIFTHNKDIFWSHWESANKCVTSTTT